MGPIRPMGRIAARAPGSAIADSPDISQCAKPRILRRLFLTPNLDKVAATRGPKLSLLIRVGEAVRAGADLTVCSNVSTSPAGHAAGRVCGVAAGFRSRS